MDSKTLDTAINVGGKLMSFSTPVVMGILNVTPDSFFADSRSEDEATVRRRARQIIDEGGSIIDVGACSTRPGSEPCTADEEMKRLRQALGWVRSEVPDAVISVDTFRADVARMSVEEFGAAIINDISGGETDVQMFPTVATLRVPYVLTFPRAEGMLQFFAEKIRQLDLLGVNDIIVDPGFGFGKTLDDNYSVLRHLPSLRQFGRPLLIGLSRKSMIQRVLDCDAAHALTGTIVLDTICLAMDCAQILRVHDVREAAESIRLTAFFQGRED